MKTRVWILWAIAFGAALCLCACGGSSGSAGDDPEETWGYMQISQEEARRMMEEDPNAIVLDVRTEEEYEEGHIPGAICIPNESIGEQRPEELPVLDQRILVYCRSGNRSKEASQKLADMGYTNVHEFGGINSWTEETVAGKEPEGGSTED